MKRWVLATLLLPAAVTVVPAQSAQAAQAAACRPTLTKLSLSAKSVTGGKSLTGKVTLSCRPGKAVKVKVARFKGVAVPASVTVAKRKNSATFTVRTAATRTARGGKVTATLGKVRRSAALTVRPKPAPTCAAPKPTGLAMPALVHVGETPTATVKLSCAPKADTRLKATASDARLVVPASVVVRKGQRQVSFRPRPTGVYAPQYQATLTVGLGAQKLRRAVTVDPGLKSVEISPSSDMNGVSPNVSFTGPAPAGGLTVRLASDNPAVTVPETAYFQPGAYGGGVGRVTVRPVTKKTTVTISFTLGTRTLKAAKVLVPPFDDSGTIQIIPQESDELHGLEFSRGYIVALSAPAPANGVKVTLKAVGADADAVQLDGTTDEVGDGSTSAYFRLSTADVKRTVHLTLVATAGKATASLPLVVHPGVHDIVLPTEVKGGTSFQGTVTLAGPAETDQVVYLSQSRGGVEVPSSVTIPAGKASATFTVMSGATDEPMSVFFTAYLGRQSFNSHSVTITP